MLEAAPPGYVRAGIGLFLVLYSIHGSLRPELKAITAGGAPADTGIGFLNGVVGGVSGLAGIVVVIWCGLRGWPKDAQRAVFQPVAVAVFLMSALWLGARGAVSTDTVWLFVIGLPALLAGTWLGLKLYGRLDEARFRNVVLIVLLVSGAALSLLEVSH